MATFTSKVLYTPLQKIEDAVLSVENGAIVSVTSRNHAEAASNKAVTDFGDCAIVPGFFDIHIHGGVNCDVMRGSADEMKKLETFLARHGVTSYLPTTVTASQDATLSALERLANAIESADKNEGGRARPLGIHLEGPFLSHARRGVHPTVDLVEPSLGAFDRLWQAARGHVRMLTIAPELNGAEEVIAEATKRGVCVSIGHSDATLEQARRGVKAGARHATHTFNAMRPLDHRAPGILGEVLTNNHLSADVICDGIHVDPTVVDLLFRAKGIENFVLITDAMSATGMPDGRYQLGTLEVELKDGRCTRDGNLAGSALTMDRAVRNVMKFARLHLQQAARAASLNPAKTTGIKKGTIEPGADADFVVLTPAGEVRATVAKGVLVQ
ncbi:MAG TPA: N-acetylglucosamine-6-phosphate deacetylase [Terriglobales bacterium]|jgi:N-acetylglucosamine-6-phosphate deacetylase|nr:N-acetylglucosamine-6-phosphate deacetylase [Terriglobales bacterium]